MRQCVVGLLAIMVAALVLSGCDSVSTDKHGDDSLISDFGGYTTANETAGFGDPDLIARCREDTPFDDDIADSPEVAAASRNRRAKFYMLRMVWGNIDNADTSEDSGPCAVTDWSGEIQASGGVLIVSRLIRFEPDDYIVRPRRAPREVQWVSHTRNHFDGILIEVIDVPGHRGGHDRDSLTITTPFFTAAMPFDSLATLDLLNTYDDCNKLSVVSTQLPPFHCPRGFLEGTWVSETDTSGNFEGAWIGQGGELTGYLHGHYGMRDSERVLFGKWITTSGGFGGLLRGTWNTLGDSGHHARRGPAGYFEGTWVNDALTAEGDFRGHYMIPADSDSGGFRGGWVRDCR